MNSVTPPLKLSFQDALRHPLAIYEAQAFDSDTSLSAGLVRVLVDHKRGRTRQAHKRYVSLLSEAGFDPDKPLLSQRNKLTEEHAQLFPIDLLFMLSDVNVPPPSEIDDYFDVLEFLGPDDRVLHGALYNTLLPLALRQGQHASARQLAALALQEYEAARAPYLMAFVHFHIAIIDIADGDMAAAFKAITEAERLFKAVPQTLSEMAQCQVVRAWLDLERYGQVPEQAVLDEIQSSSLTGELWTEPFLMLAAVQFRSRMQTGQDDILERHAELEVSIRVRRMTALLPAMQLLRDEFRCTHGNGPQAFKPAALHPLQLLLLQPTVLSMELNGSAQADNSDLPRLNVLRHLREAHQALQTKNFARAAEHMWPALEMIEGAAFFGLLKNEVPKIDIFLAECRARRRFVEQARKVRNTLLPRVQKPQAHRDTPASLTQSEYAVLLMLPQATSNKAIARDMGLSEPTVKFHLRNIYRKLGVNRRRDAIKQALALGWISLNGPADHSGT